MNKTSHADIILRKLALTETTSIVKQMKCNGVINDIVQNVSPVWDELVGESSVEGLLEDCWPLKQTHFFVEPSEIELRVKPHGKICPINGDVQSKNTETNIWIGRKVLRNWAYRLHMMRACNVPFLPWNMRASDITWQQEYTKPRMGNITSVIKERVTDNATR